MPLDGHFNKHSLRCMAPRIALLVAAALGLLALVAVAFRTSSQSAEHRSQERDTPPKNWWDEKPKCSFQEGGSCPARQLLESHDVCQAVAKNVVALGSLAHREISEKVAFEAAAGVFETIGAKLHLHAPKMANKLREVPMRAKEHQAILDMLLLMGDYEVQRIGKFVAKAITEESSMQMITVTHHIRQHLESRWDSIRVLRNRAVPGSVRALWGDGDPELVLWENRSYRAWELTLEVKNAQERVSLEASLAESRSLDFAVWAATMVQGRAVLDVLQTYVRLRGHTAIETELGSTFDFASPALSWPCQLDLVYSSADGRDPEATQEVMCPMKFGAMGLDALRATFVDDASAAIQANMPPSSQAT